MAQVMPFNPPPLPVPDIPVRQLTRRLVVIAAIVTVLQVGAYWLSTRRLPGMMYADLLVSVALPFLFPVGIAALHLLPPGRSLGRFVFAYNIFSAAMLLYVAFCLSLLLLP